jgi:hypothetical protein
VAVPDAILDMVSINLLPLLLPTTALFPHLAGTSRRSLHTDLALWLVHKDHDAEINMSGFSTLKRGVHDII